LKILISIANMRNKSIKTLHYYVIKADGRIYSIRRHYFFCTGNNNVVRVYVGTDDQVLELAELLLEARENE